MYNFKDLRPEWQVPDTIKSISHLKELGCSSALIEWVCRPRVGGELHFMVPPKDWFWRDRDWYGKDSRQYSDEIEIIAGGNFSRMNIEEQCDLLGVTISRIKGQKAKDVRSKWQGKDGLVSVERLALEGFQNEGVSGFDFESAAYIHWCLATGDRYEELHGGISGFEKINGQHIPTRANEKNARISLACLREANRSIERLFRVHSEKYDLANPRAKITLSTLRQFTELVGWELIERIFYLGSRHGVSTVNGWPDLTLKIDGKLKFIEVKSSDRLRGNQALWIRNVARPLGLDVSVIKVEQL